MSILAEPAARAQRAGHAPASGAAPEFIRGKLSVGVFSPELDAWVRSCDPASQPPQRRIEPQRAKCAVALPNHGAKSLVRCNDRKIPGGSPEVINVRDSQIFGGEKLFVLPASGHEVKKFEPVLGKQFLERGQL